MEKLLWPVILLVALVVFIALRVRRSNVGWRAWACYQVACVHRLLMTSCRQRNACTIPEEGAAIIVGNHTSPMDPMLLWSNHYSAFRSPGMRVIGWMMAREYFEASPIISWISRAMQCIPVDRDGKDMQSVRQSLQRLKDGKLLGIFPEGGLNEVDPDVRLRVGNTGATWLALKSGAPVIPVFIHDAPRSLSMVRCFLMRGKASLSYGEPIDLSRWQKRRLSDEELAEATDTIMRAIADLGGIGYTPVLQTEESEAEAAGTENV